MSTSTVTIDPFGFPMEVDFTYTPASAGSFYEPPEREDAEIEALRVGGVDIGEMLTIEQWRSVETALMRKIHQEQEDARVDAAESYAADRANGYSNVFFDALNRITGTR